MPNAARGSIRVRAATEADTARTAQVHARCLPAGFFARLGPRFLARYHGSFLGSPHATSLVAEDPTGTVIGFVVGTFDNARHYRSVLRRPPPSLLAAGVGSLVRDPRRGAEFVRTRLGRYLKAIARQLRARRTVPAAAPVAGTPREVVAVLTHVAVDDAARGTGAGRALVEAFVDRTRAAGAREVRLVTDADGGAGGFYRRLGWASRGTRAAADGTVVEEFALRL